MSDRFAWDADDVDLEELEEAELDRLGLIQVPEVLTESRLLAEAATTSLDTLGRRQRLLLISEGWGSSGYYSADLLRRVAPLFEVGTHQYIDHPSRSENDDRPERSLRDLAAVLATTAEYDPATRGLYAVSDVFPAYRQFLAEMKDYIGVSIRASGTVEYGEAEGREGPIVTSISAVESVDFVTRAGRGGRIVELLESARAQALEERVNWREEDHPRGFGGRFGHGSGGGSSHGDHSGGGGNHSGGSHGGHNGGGHSGSGRAGRSRASVVQTGSGPVTVMRHHDGSGTVQMGGKTLHLKNEREHKAFASDVGALRFTSTSSSNRTFQIGSERPIMGDGDQPLAMIKRTGDNDFELHLRPHDGATREETSAAPGFAVTDREAEKINDAMSAHSRAAAEEEKAAKAAARQANIDAGAVDRADVARRASGKPVSDAGPDGRGLPDTIASESVKTAGGDELTLHREAGDDYVHVTTGDGRSYALTEDELREIRQVMPSESGEDMESDRVGLVDGEGFTFGQMSKVGPDRFAVQIDGQDAFTVGGRDYDQLGRAQDRLGVARRFDTGNGDVDMYLGDRKKPTLRVVDADGKPQELAFDRRSFQRLNDAFDVIYEGFDESEKFRKGDAADHVTNLEIKTNVGKIRLDGIGDWRSDFVDGKYVSGKGEAVEVGASDGSWKIRLDGNERVGGFSGALTELNDAEFMESRRSPAGARLVEAKVSDTPWSEFGAGDYDLGQWRRACLLSPAEPSDSKDDYSLPVREPDGTLNRNAVHAAASRIGQVKADPAAKRAAARTLVRLYGQLGEDPPAGLADLAGTRRKTMTKESAMRHAEPEQPTDLAAAEAVRRLVEAAGITANDLRDALTDEVRDVYGGEGTHVWLRDWTDEWVVFSMEDNIGPETDLFQQGYTLSGREVTLTGDPTPVRAVTTYEPEPEPEPDEPAPKTGPTTSNPTTTKTEPGTAPATMKEGTMPEITEEQARQLAEAANLSTQLTQAMTRLDEAGTQIAQLREHAAQADARALRLQNTEDARTLMAEALTAAGSSIPTASHKGLVESVLRDLPTTESGQLDRDAFKALAEAAITDKKTEIAGLLEEAGIGSVRGLGESHPEPLTEPDFETSIAESFQRLGLSDDAAKIAATGRR